eukprot:TRINITY_DN820_c0_g1_i3.p1 TRINITY_DN820_c0_g1~~TRINITY_DN820_c0_g1_i3.p1  ORF type:complete len:116 (-),score=46.83 TRINITY_DN820_c0_g1_i3:360-707(-)
MQEADEEGFYFGAKLADVPANKGLRVRINRKEIALFKVKADKTRVYAMSNKCSHQGTSLAGGDIEDLDGHMCVRCPGHGIQFNLRNGKSLQDPKLYKQKVYNVKKKEDEIWVKLD